MSSKISSASNSQNRFALKNYYRGSAGFMSFMNSVFMLAVVAIAFYIAENFTSIANSTADSDNGIASLYYVVVFFGLFVFLCGIIIGIAGMRGENDGNFKNQRVVAVVSAGLYVLYAIGAIMSFTGEEYNINDTFYIGIYLIGVCISIAGCVYSVFVFIMTTKALKYCDDKKGKVQDVPADMDKEALEKRRVAVMLSGYGFISLSIWLMCFYFQRQVILYEKSFATDCGVAPMMFMVLTVLGSIGIVYTIVCMLMNIKNKKSSYTLTKQSAIYNTVAILILLIFCILTTGEVYVKVGYPALEYYIFTYVLGAFATGICYTIYSRIRKQKQ